MSFFAQIKYHLAQIGLALTRLGNTLLGGRADESMSSRSFRAEGNGKAWGRLTRPIIDFLADLLGDENHCAGAYANERKRPNLPKIGQ